MDDSGKPDGDVHPTLSNAFSREYLDRLREGSETSASGEGEAAGPWELRHEEGVYPLFRSWEGFEHGDSPEAVFQLREAGLLFFAVRPATGRDPLFSAPDPATEHGFAVESAGQVVGHLRFFNPTTLTTSPIQVPRDRLDPGAPLGRSAAQQFAPGAQSLLVTFATNASETVGQLFQLTQPAIQLGRRGDQDILVPEATVSGAHATLRWQAGSWIVEDRGSTNGTYADHSYERKAQVALMHGGEVQTGELRLKLVSFQPDSPHHQRARAFLNKRDGLTGLLARTHLLWGLDDEAAFSEWAEATMTVARYELRGPNRLVSERPTILEMLALRRAAQRVVELTEMLLLSLSPVVAGRTGPLKFAVAMVGPSLEEARQVVEQVAAQVAGMLPESIELGVTIVKAEPKRPGRTLID